MSTIVGQRRTWRLERDDRTGSSVAAFVAEPGLTVYAESAPASTPTHRCPAWKLVAPLSAAPVVVDQTPHDGPVLVPPMTSNAAWCGGAFVAVFLDAWCWPTDLERLPLPPRRAVVSWGKELLLGTGELSDLCHLLRSMWGPRPVSRAGVAAETLRRTNDLSEPARVLGLSPSRARTVVRDGLGCTLTDVRRWLRLIDAYAALGDHGPAFAATNAGFADQPHFTRTATTYVGRTPGTIHRGLRY